MTVLSSGGSKATALALLMLALLGAAGLYFRSEPITASAASETIPPGLVPGATITSVSLWGSQSYVVEEVSGQWVRGTVVKAEGWRQGAHIWVNLNALESVWIQPPPEPPAQTSEEKSEE